MHVKSRTKSIRAVVGSVAVGLLILVGAAAARRAGGGRPDRRRDAKRGGFVDLTVLISEQLPAHWPTHAPFQRWTFNWFKPVSGAYRDNLAQSVFPYYGQRYVIDEHTGTQTDCPAHFIPPEGSGMPFASPMG